MTFRRDLPDFQDINWLCTKSTSTEKIFSRKGAKAQSATAFLKGFLCAFAPLREKYFSFPDSISDFSCKARKTLAFMVRAIHKQLPRLTSTHAGEKRAWSSYLSQQMALRCFS
jgi:hypothetical protein